MINLSAGKIDLFKDVLTGACHQESAWEPLATRAWDVNPRPFWRRRAEKILHRWLDRRGWTLVKRREYNEENRRAGLDWPLFGYTMVGRIRLDSLQKAVETILSEDIEGDFIETGVWRGGACMLMKALLQQAGDCSRSIWLADSFAGLPPPEDTADGWDLSGHPQLTVAADEVRKNFERFGLWDEGVMLLKGWFHETLPSAPVRKLAILRLDGDLYESTKVALDSLYDRVSPGGFVIIDDYHAWPGCKRAVEEFRSKRGEAGVVCEIDGTAVFWRK